MQAKHIAEQLGIKKLQNGFIEVNNNATVTWAVGHLLRLQDPKDYDTGWDNRTVYPMLPKPFRYKPNSGTKKQLAVIRKLLATASVVVIATDADREGEAIGREILDYAGYRGEIKRFWTTALDPSSVQQGLRSLKPGAATLPLYRSAKAREQADWLFGMNLSRAAQVNLSKSHSLSVGRVQTPTLKLVVDRDRSIENFISVPFYEISAEVQSGKHSLTLYHKRSIDPDQRIYKKSVAHALLKQALDFTGELVVNKENKKSAPPKLFSLSGLQRECSTRWGWTARKTLDIAQQLYATYKIISYPRSDSVYLPEEQIEDIPTILTHLSSHSWFKERLPFDVDPVIRKAVFNNEKVAQSSHHAVVPTTFPAELEKLDSDHCKAYELIASYYVAALMPDYRFAQTTIVLQANDLNLKTIGRTPLDAGWKALKIFQPQSRKNNSTEEPIALLPDIDHGAPAHVLEGEVITRKTSPPTSYTEGTLIGDMASVAKFVSDESLKKRLKETSGIGTEATRSNIIEKLKKRRFLKVKKRNIHSSPLGRALIDALPQDVSNPGTTAVWEDALSAIANGQLDDSLFMEAIEKQLSILLRDIESSAGSISLPEETPSNPLKREHCCPSCAKALSRLKNRSKESYFWGCVGYPQCKVRIPDKEGVPDYSYKKGRTLPTPDDAPKCPACDAQMVLREGGHASRFWGCSTFPKCRKTEPYRDSGAQTGTG